MKFEKSNKSIEEIYKERQLIQETKDSLYVLGKRADAVKEDFLQTWYLRKDINLLLQNLPFEQKTVIELYYGLSDGKNLSQRKTAKTLNMPRKEVRNHLKEATKFLSPRVRFIESLAQYGSLTPSEKHDFSYFFNVNDDN